MRTATRAVPTAEAHLIMRQNYMKKDNLFNKYLLAKPTIRMLIEWPILIAIGIIGTIFSLQTIPFFPISNIVGVVLLIVGFSIHRSSHKTHKQAHQQSEKIQKLATGGIYSKIRHPGYLSLILIYFGFMFVWGIVWILVPVLVFATLTVLTAIREEKAMQNKFGKDYEEYTSQVQWRFIPKLF
jgi:protein-S-isoprenylcysteine O-methyltransferase Ste14